MASRVNHPADVEHSCATSRKHAHRKAELQNRQNRCMVLDARRRFFPAKCRNRRGEAAPTKQFRLWRQVRKAFFAFRRARPQPLFHTRQLEAAVFACVIARLPRPLHVAALYKFRRISIFDCAPLRPELEHAIRISAAT